MIYLVSFSDIFNFLIFNTIDPVFHQAASHEQFWKGLNTTDNINWRCSYTNNICKCSFTNIVDSVFHVYILDF